MLNTGHNFSHITLSDLLAESKKLKTIDEHNLLLKSLGRVGFNLLWRRFNGDVTLTRVFTNIGQVTQFAIGDQYESKTIFKMTLKRIKDSALLGKIRSKVPHSDDIRFIVYSDGERIYLFLDNEASNVRLDQAHIFDPKAGTFIPCEKVSLVDSLISNKILF